MYTDETLNVPMHSETQIFLPDSEIHALPPELLRTIFRYCLQIPQIANYPYSPVSDEPSPPTSSTPPLNVSQVCRYWRTVAVSSPSLWTQIDLSSPNSLADLLRGKALIDLWLSRSASSSYPIDVDVLQKYAPDDTGLNAVLGHILEDLVHRRANWRHIRICSRGDDPVEFPFCLDRMAKLRTAIILNIACLGNKINISNSTDLHK